MATARLDEGQWHQYFETAEIALRGRTVTVQVMAPDLGAQVAAENVGLLGITYDTKDRLLEVALDGLDHRIRQPREIHVHETPDGLAAIEAVDADGRRHVIQFGNP